MGMDISMDIVKDGKILHKNIYDGRNREWFSNLQGNGWNDVYDKLPTKYGLSPMRPENYEKYESEDGEISDITTWGFGFNHISVKDFTEWFEAYRPDIDAGWVSTYDRWRIINKGYVPEDLDHYLDPDVNPADYHFMEVVDPYEPSGQIYNFLIEHDVPIDADIQYWFDN